MPARLAPNRLVLSLLVGACGVVALGCQGESKPAAADSGPLINIQTPIGDVKINRDPATGRGGVDVKSPIGNVKVDRDPDSGRGRVDVDAGGVQVDVGPND